VDSISILNPAGPMGQLEHFGMIGFAGKINGVIMEKYGFSD
jgi:hypothetical protein